MCREGVQEGGECLRLVQNATFAASSALEIFEFKEFWTISNEPSLMKSSGFKSLRRGEGERMRITARTRKIAL